MFRQGMLLIRTGFWTLVPRGGAVWGGLGSVALPEEGHHQVDFESPLPDLVQSTLCFVLEVKSQFPAEKRNPFLNCPGQVVLSQHQRSERQPGPSCGAFIAKVP